MGTEKSVFRTSYSYWVLGVRVNSQKKDVPMQLSFTLNLRRYPSDHDLHHKLRLLGFADGGFIPPRFGFNRRLGVMNYPKLLKEAQRLDRLCPDWVPFILDLERAFRWARHTGSVSLKVPLSPEQSYDLIRETYNFMRLHFPERYLTDWGRNARWTHVLTDRLGCGITAVSGHEPEDTAHRRRSMVGRSFTRVCRVPNVANAGLPVDESLELECC